MKPKTNRNLLSSSQTNKNHEGIAAPTSSVIDKKLQKNFPDSFKANSLKCIKTISTGSKIINAPTVLKDVKSAKPESNFIGGCIDKNIKGDYLNLIKDAIESNKVFSIGRGSGRSYQTVRESLNTRGWFEKCSPEILYKEGVISNEVFANAKRLLDEVPLNFIWAVNGIDFKAVKDFTIVSKFPKQVHFTTKVGLCHFLEEFHWFYQTNLAQTVSPRTFILKDEHDIDHFTKEFGLTACVSLLKIIVDNYLNTESDFFVRGGKVPVSIANFAESECSKYILHRKHLDIDKRREHQTTAKEWEEFLSWFYKVAREEEYFKMMAYSTTQALYAMSKKMLTNIRPYWPMLEIEGYTNLWVVKPARGSCGRGVKIMGNLEKIIRIVKTNGSNKIKDRVVQKYIERPLLIYDTKFDIRQWFVVTSVYPLVIWIYKECYLRFSSQQFSLEDLHESIHLTNYSVQRNYTNNCSRNPKLPIENMWHDLNFKDYLKDIKQPDKWDKVILPGIKQGIIGAVLASQEEMVDRKRSFELYGADFLLGSDYTPILLEINESPDMRSSTAVTADLCTRVLQDVVKVVLDVKQNPCANTGQFELLFRQKISNPSPYYNGIGLVVTGSKITDVQTRKQNKHCNR